MASEVTTLSYEQQALARPIIFFTICVDLMFRHFQLFLGTEHALLLPEDYEPEVWQLRLRSAPSDPQHLVRKHPERDVHM